MFGPLKEALKNHIPIKKKFHSISPEEATKLRRQYKDDPDRVIKLIGVETNVCVLTNAIMLHNSFPLATITVLKDLCAASSEKRHNEALNILESLKIEIY